MRRLLELRLRRNLKTADAKALRHLLLWAVLVALLLACFGCKRADLRQTLRAQSFQGVEKEPEVLAAYQPWFGRPGHINVGYSSQDRTVLRKQIDEARSLGIRAFVINWYGRSAHPSVACRTRIQSV